MRITVAINTTDNAAPPVTERILSTQEALTARGKSELYSKAGDVNEHSVSMPLQSLILPSDIVQVSDAAQGETWVARNKSCSISISDKGITQNISLERPV